VASSGVANARERLRSGGRERGRKAHNELPAIRRGYPSDDEGQKSRQDAGGTKGKLAEIFVAEVGYGLLIEVGVIGAEGVAEGGVH
jgi:hypothetical protein